MPVHGIGFNCREKKFAYTVGGDGCINYWDFEKKSKIRDFKYKGFILFFSLILKLILQSLIKIFNKRIKFIKGYIIIILLLL